MDAKPVETGDVASLRTEIVESQKSRIDLLKYKLVSVAALGSVGLGLGSYHGNDGNSILRQDYVLCIIPLACIYVDLLCYHNNMRILVIAKYLKSMGNEYEKYISGLGEALQRDGIAKKEGYLFELEDWSLIGSTIFLSLVITAIGFFMDRDCIKGSVFIIAGIFGIVTSIIAYVMFVRHAKKLDSITR